MRKLYHFMVNKSWQQIGTLTALGFVSTLLLELKHPFMAGWATFMQVVLFSLRRNLNPFPPRSSPAQLNRECCGQPYGRSVGRIF
jgi:hypothetical protein